MAFSSSAGGDLQWLRPLGAPAGGDRHILDAMRRLLTEGFRSETPMEAAVLVATVVAEHLGADRTLVLYYRDEQRSVIEAATVGVPPDMDGAVRHAVTSLPGSRKVAGWRRRAGTTLEVEVVDDTSAYPARPGGVVETLALGAFMGIPLLGAEGAVGRVLCGFSRPHAWAGPERDFATRLAMVGAAVIEAARLRQAERSSRAELEYRATHDVLTGLLNREAFTERLSEVLKGDAATVAVLLLDLDRFKDVNDTLGHHAGDELLAAAADRIRSSARSEDTVARLGGDEFGVVVASDSALADAERVAWRVADALAVPFCIAGVTATVDASVGIAAFPDHGGDAGEVLARADVAMYQAKRSGASVAVYSAATDGNSVARLGLLGQLRGVLDGRGPHGGLRLHYQPKYHLPGLEVAGVEALLRWYHPDLGLLGPDQFVPLAESGGLGRRVTDWVVRRALSQASAWARAGVGLPVAVNITARDLADPGFPPAVAAALRRSGLPPDQLTLEITETQLVADRSGAAAALASLRELGVRISLDDFGTGYSSLAYLESLPVDELKIDRAFFAEGGLGVVAASIVELGHRLAISVVAEGIEDRDGLERACFIGADQAQGFYLGRPDPEVPLPEAAAGTGRGRERVLVGGVTPAAVGAPLLS